MAKSRLGPYLIESFTNKKGHVINPGDDIVIVTTGAHIVGVEIGRYLGKRKTGSFRGVDNYHVVVSINKVRTTLVRNDNETIEWQSSRNKRPDDLTCLLKKEEPYPPWPGFPGWDRRAETPEYRAKKAEYDRVEELNIKIGEYNRQIIDQYKKNNYHEVQISYVVYRTLKRNRIYPINMG